MKMTESPYWCRKCRKCRRPAQQRQIDKLTTALGSNPEDIADRTAKAVSDKIDKLVITMTAQEKDTAK